MDAASQMDKPLLLHHVHKSSPNRCLLYTGWRLWPKTDRAKIRPVLAVVMASVPWCRALPDSEETRSMIVVILSVSEACPESAKGISPGCK
jgi:hypothetical protein